MSIQGEARFSIPFNAVTTLSCRVVREVGDDAWKASTTVFGTSRSLKKQHVLQITIPVGKLVASIKKYIIQNQLSDTEDIKFHYRIQFFIGKNNM